jgi:hypothetical protein
MIWKTLLWMPHLLFWGALAWIVFGLFGNRRSARVLKNGRIEFAPHWLTIWAWLFILGCIAMSASKGFLQGQGSLWHFVYFTCLGLAAFGILIDYPASIVITNDGIVQVYWLRRNKRICWEDIVEIESGPKDRLITIIGADGTKIVHTRFLADRSRLLLELKQHCGENLPTDFPREPIDGL